MNIEVDGETLSELESAFRFNDAVIRNMIISRKSAITGNSKIFEEELREQEKEKEREQRREQEYAERRARAEGSDEEDSDIDSDDEETADSTEEEEV